MSDYKHRMTYKRRFWIRNPHMKPHTIQDEYLGSERDQHGNIIHRAVDKETGEIYIVHKEQGNVLEF